MVTTTGLNSNCSTLAARSIILFIVLQLGHVGEKKGEEGERSEDFTRRDQHHFGLRDLEVMETLGESYEYKLLHAFYQYLLMFISCSTSHYVATFTPSQRQDRWLLREKVVVPSFAVCQLSLKRTSSSDNLESLLTLKVQTERMIAGKREEYFDMLSFVST